MQAKVLYSNVILLMLVFMCFLLIGCADPETTDEDKYTETTISLQQAKEIIVQSLAMEDNKSNRDIFNIWNKVQITGMVHNVEPSVDDEMNMEFDVRFNYQNSTYHEIIVESIHPSAGVSKSYSPNGQDLYQYLNELPYGKNEFNDAALFFDGLGYNPKFSDSDFEIYLNDVVKKGYSNNFNLILNFDMDMKKYLEYIQSFYPNNYEENVGTIQGTYVQMTNNQPTVNVFGEINIEFTDNVISKITANIGLQSGEEYYTKMNSTLTKYDGEVTTPEWFDIADFENINTN